MHVAKTTIWADRLPNACWAVIVHYREFAKGATVAASQQVLDK